MTTQARGFGQYGVTRYVDANGNAIEVGNVIPGGLGNTGLATGSAEAIARAPLNLSQVSGEASFVTRVSMSNLARNDGKLGEALALDLMQSSTGLSFRSIQNNSGHGVDLLGIDDANMVIWAPEVKSSINGAFPDPSTSIYCSGLKTGSEKRPEARLQTKQLVRKTKHMHSAFNNFLRQAIN